MTERSPIIAFYEGTAPDSSGRRIEEIWSWNHRQLEMVHDFIQWLFPLPEPSRFNPDAPLLASADINAFRSNANLQNHVRKSLDVMLDFLGLMRTGTKIARGPAFTPDIHWLAPANHNHLRLTR